MTKPLRDQKIIFVLDNGVSIYENLTRKEVKDFETMTPNKKEDFIAEHEEDFVFYSGKIVNNYKNKAAGEEYFHDLHEYILDSWKDNGTVTDEENARFNIETITYLLCNYRLKCLIATIIDIKDLWSEFDEN